MTTYRGTYWSTGGLPKYRGGLLEYRGGGLIEYLQGDLLEHGVVGGCQYQSQCGWLEKQCLTAHQCNNISVCACGPTADN